NKSLLKKRVSKASEVSVHVTEYEKSIRLGSFPGDTNTDIVQDLYLNELRAYRPPAVDASAKANLVDKFTLPTPPPAPGIEASVSDAVVTEDAMEEEEWPPVYNPIEDPHNYNSEWEFRTEVDNGKLLPEMLKPYDYHGDH
ncbi:hypothetical protein HDU96_004358, partial [Phlyctochytrium bullatum]